MQIVFYNSTGTSTNYIYSKTKSYNTLYGLAAMSITGGINLEIDM
jgi:hypothetical protein